MAFKPVGSLLKSSPVHSKSSGAIGAMRVRQVAFDQIKKEMMNVCDITTIKVSTYRAGTLTINAPALVSTELHMRSDRLLEAINRVLGIRLVKALRFKNY